MSDKANTNKAGAADRATAAQGTSATTGNTPTDPRATEGAPLAGMAAAPACRPVCAVRFGRGRLGGSMGMDPHHPSVFLCARLTAGVRV